MLLGLMRPACLVGGEKGLLSYILNLSQPELCRETLPQNGVK